jgi:uncharacterized membrane protein YhiD involved in acid resistance
MDMLIMGAILGLSGLFTAAFFWLAAAIWS